MSVLNSANYLQIFVQLNFAFLHFLSCNIFSAHSFQCVEYSKNVFYGDGDVKESGEVQQKVHHPISHLK